MEKLDRFVRIRVTKSLRSWLIVQAQKDCRTIGSYIRKLIEDRKAKK
jgi:hypothetical protein